jgi:hypothetical protein
MIGVIRRIDVNCIYRGRSQEQIATNADAPDRIAGSERSAIGQIAADVPVAAEGGGLVYRDVSEHVIRFSIVPPAVRESKAYLACRLHGSTIMKLD